MSRIGKMPVTVPKGVEATEADGTLSVKGPKGSLMLALHPDMNLLMKDDELLVERPSDQKEHRALHGLTRSLIQNMMTGVTDGLPRRLRSSVLDIGLTPRVVG